MMGKHHIDGEWVASRMGRRRAIINPANGDIIAEVSEGDRNDAKDAILAARQAFDSGAWRRSSGEDRARVLNRIASEIKRNKDELAELETLDTGKTLQESQWDIDQISEVFRYYAKLSLESPHEALKAPNPKATSELVREAIGVCALILPWNYPLGQAAWKLAPALAAGCTVILKPSEFTPMTTLRLTEIATGGGLPHGVINTVLGSGEEVGKELVENPLVDMVSFTGGIESAKEIAAASSGTLKKLTMELGGKNPNIIFDDADFEVAIDQALNAVFFHAGQICSAGARLIVHDSIHDRFVESLLGRMRRIKVGPGILTESEMGPLISETHRERVASYVALGVEEGATLLCGGQPPSDPESSKGFFFAPTLFIDCESTMRISREEIFGPIITVEKFKNDAEAIEKANETIYGLAAGLWTRDRKRIQTLTQALRFGTIWVNDYNVFFPAAPWGGFKQSGLGRELGRTGLEEYRELKHIYENHAPEALNLFGMGASHVEEPMMSLPPAPPIPRAPPKPPEKPLPSSNESLEIQGVPALITGAHFPALLETHEDERSAPATTGEKRVRPTTVVLGKTEAVLFGEKAIVHGEPGPQKTRVRGSRLAVMMASRTLKTALISEKDVPEMNTLVEELELKTYLDQSFSRTEHEEQSLSAIYRYAAESLGIPAQHCLVFEKGMNEILAAQEAGMRVFALGNEPDSTRTDSPIQGLDFIENFMDLPADFFDLLEADRLPSGFPVIPDRSQVFPQPDPCSTTLEEDEDTASRD